MADKQFVEESHAQIYSAYRKDNPEELIQKIVSYVKKEFQGSLNVALDVGCGSGQSSVILQPYFQKVYGLDSSEAQITHAKNSRSLPNLEYLVSPSETLPFEDGSVQLVTAATSLHWFNLDEFFPEVRRVLCNNGVLAVYGYMSMKPLLAESNLCEQIDVLYENYYKELHPYLHPQYLIVKNKYKDVDFPFEDVARCEDHRHVFDGYLSDVVGYVGTFSGFQNLRKADDKKAEECISSFKNRLYQIVASSGISTSEKIELYRDYMLILCRKTVS